jgi:hypothetical protein
MAARAKLSSNVKRTKKTTASGLNSRSPQSDEMLREQAKAPALSLRPVYYNCAVPDRRQQSFFDVIMASGAIGVDEQMSRPRAHQISKPVCAKLLVRNNKARIQNQQKYKPSCCFSDRSEAHG